MGNNKNGLNEDVSLKPLQPLHLYVCISLHDSPVWVGFMFAWSRVLSAG